MPLTRIQLKLLRDALCDAFDPDSLEEMVRYRLGQKLDNFVARSNMETMARKLIDAFEQRGTTNELIRAVYETRPRNPLVSAYCNQHAQFVFDPLKPPKEVAESVGAGFTALASIVERLPAGGVRHIIQTFRDDFRVTRTRIEWLERYKALHDCLHNLDYKYYRELERAVANFRKDDVDAELLEDYTSDLAHEVKQARKKAQALPSYQAENRWLDQFDRAVAELRQALDGPDNIPTQRALQLLERLLKTEPSRINQCLTLTAGEPRLEELIRAMRQVRDATGQAAPQDSSLPLQELRDGLKDLEGLQPRLMGRIEEHWRWQSIDIDLRWADASSGQSLEDVLDAWPNVRRAAQSLCDLSREASWAKELKCLADRVDAASAGKNPVQLRTTFKRFRRAAMRQFYNVDIDLRGLCDKLVLIGGPLDAVLKVIGYVDN